MLQKTALIIAFFWSTAAAAAAGLQSMLDEADQLIADERLPEAARLLEAAAARAESEGRDRLEEIHADAVKVYYAMGDFRRALTHQRHLLDAALDFGDRLEAADAAVNTAVLAARLKSYKEADYQLAFAEIVYTEITRLPALARVTHYQGIVAQGRSDLARCLERFTRSRELYLQAGNGKEAARRLLDLGNIHKDSENDYPRAIAAYDQAIEEFRALGHEDLVLATEIDKGNTLIELGELTAADELLSRVAARIRPEREPLNHARAQQMLAKARYRQGLYSHALSMVERILAGLDAITNREARTRTEIDAVNLRGLIAAELGRFESAFTDFRAAIALATDHGLRAKEAVVRNNLGFWLRERGLLHEALSEHERALAIDREAESPDGMAFDLRNIGLTRLALGELQTAIASFTSALDFATQVGGAYNIAFTHLGLGEARLREGDWAAALVHYRMAIETAEKSGLKGFSWQAHAGLAAAAAASGQDPAMAEEHYNKAIVAIERLIGGLGSVESRRGFKESARVQDVFRRFERLLRERGKPREADAVLRRAAAAPDLPIPTI